MKAKNDGKFKFCPACGKQGLSFHDDRSVACPHCRFRWFFNVSAAVVALIWNDREELLLTRRALDPAKGMLDLPGGFMEFDETAEAAVKREVKEEINIEIRDMRYLGSFPGNYCFDAMDYDVINLVYSCVAEDLTVMARSDEIAECVFLSRKRIDLEQVGIEAIRKVIQKYVLGFERAGS